MGLAARDPSLCAGGGRLGPAATVAAAMLTRPSTLPAAATLDEVRAVLADDHVHLVLLVEGVALVGTLDRQDLADPPDGPGRGPAVARARLSGRTTRPDAPAEAVRLAMVAEGRRRLAVVDGAGTLLGLLCLKASGAGFCSKADVAARRRAARG